MAEPTGLVEETARRLRSGVISGALKPGQRLSETSLGAELGVSRNTLREVFRVLTQEGLLRHERNRGISVTVPTMASVLDIYRVRRLIELPALAQAWPQHPAVERMRDAVARGDRCAAAMDWRGAGSANMEFHVAIVALADSARLDAFFARLSAELRLAFGLLDSAERLHRPYVGLNAEILMQLAQGANGRAAELLAGYLDHSERDVLQAFARLG